MATTHNEDQSFIVSIIPTSLLEEAISWIKNNLYPEDVFEEDQLKLWAEENNFTKEV